MKDKICLITGGNSGIGYYTALGLSKAGANIIIVSRNETRGLQAVESISKETGNKVELIIGDLSKINNVKSIAKKIIDEYEKLDVLINNAGGVYATRTETSEGLEDTFALNFLAPFVLTQALLPLLKKSDSARIVNVSSSAHNAGIINMDDLQHSQKFSRMKAYANTKLALNLFTFKLAKELEGSNVTCNALNPGFVTTTPSYASKLDSFMLALLRPLGISPPKGAKLPIYVASSPELEGINGKYFDHKFKITPASKESYNFELAQKLWKEAEKIVERV